MLIPPLKHVTSLFSSRTLVYADVCCCWPGAVCCVLCFVNGSDVAPALCATPGNAMNFNFGCNGLGGV